MHAARSTLASGPTMSTNMPKPPRARPAAAGRGSRTLRAASSSTPRTRLQLAPLTAVRCVMPTVFMAAASCGSRAPVSPVTIPGSNPLASPDNPAAAALKPLRRAAGPRSQLPAAARRTGAAEADSIPASASPAPDGFSLPVARIRCPDAASPQSAPPSTRSPACASTRRPSKIRTSSVAGTAQRSDSPTLPGVASRRGVPFTSISATTEAPAATASATAPSFRGTEATAAWAPAAHESSRAAAAVPRRLRAPAFRRRRCGASNIPAAVARAAQPKARAVGASHPPARAVPQTSSAAGTSRRSVRRRLPDEASDDGGRAAVRRARKASRTRCSSVARVVLAVASR